MILVRSWSFGILVVFPIVAGLVAFVSGLVFRYIPVEIIYWFIGQLENRL